jgi:hypothetical protein
VHSHSLKKLLVNAARTLAMLRGSHQLVKPELNPLTSTRLKPFHKAAVLKRDSDFFAPLVCRGSTATTLPLGLRRRGALTIRSFPKSPPRIARYLPHDREIDPFSAHPTQRKEGFRETPSSNLLSRLRFLNWAESFDDASNDFATTSKPVVSLSSRCTTPYQSKVATGSCECRACEA